MSNLSETTEMKAYNCGHFVSQANEKVKACTNLHICSQHRADACSLKLPYGWSWQYPGGLELGKQQAVAHLLPSSHFYQNKLLPTDEIFLQPITLQRKRNEKSSQCADKSNLFSFAKAELLHLWQAHDELRTPVPEQSLLNNTQAYWPSVTNGQPGN